ncbi:MAG TPA: 4-(cytidine 5'-diphospho)-2-C-methyl-D-erythritol kinase [Candidatus Wallbacteria bacterium]|nr:4-(cytidine 5'-diphospho)-2-C-methyl-D-erythritol kinase [Candidatus Wallbacteria bacterium]
MSNENFLLNKPLKMNSHAKVNFFLDVIKKMPDGYHEIATVFSTLELSDTLSFYFTKNEYSADYILKLFKLGFKKPVSGVVNLLNENVKVTMISDDDNEKCFSVPLDNTNTLLIAVKKFFSCVPFKKLEELHNLYIVFQKNIPAGAGLAGGSSNAACAIRALNYLLGYNMESEQLRMIASATGADVAFLLEGGCAYCGNAGDQIISFYDPPVYPMVLVYPNFEVSSRDAYNNVANHVKYNLSELSGQAEEKVRDAVGRRIGNLVEALVTPNYEKLSKFLYNKLEEPVFNRKHQIRELKDTLIQMGYPVTMMSGSGSTVYTLLDPGESEESLGMHLERIQTEMHRKFSKTYKVILTRTRKAIGWDKMLL